MNKKELVKNAFDANAWTYLQSQDAKDVAPAIFEEKVYDYQQKALVVAPQGRQIDFTRPGRSLTVTIDEAPTAASTVIETDAVSYSAITNRQVTFTPLQKAKAYQASRTEMEDGFLEFMGNASKKIGYALAQAKDDLAVTRIVAGATHTVFANGKTAATDVAASDVLDLDLIADARKKIRTSYYTPASLIVSPVGETQLLKNTNVQKANEFGTRTAIANGLLGSLYGVNIYVSDSIVAANNRESAFMLGLTAGGEESFAHALVRRPTIRMDEDIDFDQIKVVGRERYDIQVIHPGAICLLVHGSD